MRTASKVLGIVGGTIAILVAFFIIMGGLFFRAAYPNIIETADHTEFNENYPEFEIDKNEQIESTKFAGLIFLGGGTFILIAGIVGLVGGIIVNKHNIAAGIMMLLSSVVCLVIIWAILAFIPLLLGGIFALVRDNSAPKTQPVYAAPNPDDNKPDGQI